MQEYCYRSTRKDATRALLKLVANNLGIVYMKEGSRTRTTATSLFKRKPLKRRYLPHDPNMILDDTMDEQPITAEALNLHPFKNQPNIVVTAGLTGSAEEACSSGFHSVSSTSTSPVNINHENQVKPAEPEELKKRQTQLNSILLRMEKENAAVLERLTTLQESRNKIKPVSAETPSATEVAAAVKPVVETTETTLSQQQPESLSQPIDSCVAMQTQLNRLKLLMEGLFGCPAPAEDGSETPLRSKKQIIDHRQSILMELQNSLNEPSLIESTPMVSATHMKNQRNIQASMNQFQRKKLSRLALDNNFSPIVFQVQYLGFYSNERGGGNCEAISDGTGVSL
jgi:hypothetical protein